MATGFEPVRAVLAERRELGQPFSRAWSVAIHVTGSAEDRKVLEATREAWQQAYEGRA